MGALKDQRIWSVQDAITENRDYVPGADLFPLGYIVFEAISSETRTVSTPLTAPAGECPVVLFPHDVIEDGASAASVMVKPKGSMHWRNTTPPGCGGFFMVLSNVAGS